MLDFYWLPQLPDWESRLAAASQAPKNSWDNLANLANSRLDFTQTLQLDRAVAKILPDCKDAPPALRLGIGGSATTEHLIPGLRVAALRRGIRLEVYTVPYGQYRQELADKSSALHKFKPEILLFAFEAAHVLALGNVDLVNSACDYLKSLWDEASRHLNCTIFQQTFVPVAPPLLGNNEFRLPSSQHSLTAALNQRLRSGIGDRDVHIVALDDRVASDGLAFWHDPVYWHMAKQEVRPQAAPSYGELVARMIAALRGRSFKALVLDLDDTLWGGVIGEDGLDGIRLGQGDATGEAYIAFQKYLRDLGNRGIALAVCSKNDEANAWLPFEKHPEMVLKRADIACFVANWSDKATNLRNIAARLNLGLDALVFVDDNPFERELVRHELPMVAVPELPEDPAYFPACIADAGYFEGLRVTKDDLIRVKDYQANLRREDLRVTTTDLETYLRSLDMELEVSPFRSDQIARLTQLINKTNQFNLTTLRMTENEVRSLLDRPDMLTLSLHLRDRFGDSGLIGVVVGSLQDTTLVIDNWLMSCRVLGRGVERTTLALIAEEARLRGANKLIGTYIPNAKNMMVKDHYATMGFTEDDATMGGHKRWRLVLDMFKAEPAPIRILKAAA